MGTASCTTQVSAFKGGACIASYNAASSVESLQEGVVEDMARYRKHCLDLDRVCLCVHVRRYYADPSLIQTSRMNSAVPQRGRGQRQREAMRRTIKYRN